jgi:hypothetical protein
MSAASNRKKHQRHRFEDITPSRFKYVDETYCNQREEMCEFRGITAHNRIFYERIRNVYSLKAFTQSYHKYLDEEGGFWWCRYQDYFSSYLKIFYDFHGHYPKIILNVYEKHIELYSKIITESFFDENHHKFIDRKIKRIQDPCWMGQLRTMYEEDYQLVKKYYKGG